LFVRNCEKNLKIRKGKFQKRQEKKQEKDGMEGKKEVAPRNCATH
jgi:hypothetical protein